MAVPVVKPGKTLALEAAAGDPYATRELLQRVAPKVVRAVQMVLGYRAADVDDTAQHALIAFVQSLPSFRGECQPEWYAARIAVRLAVANRKRQRATAAQHDDGASPEAVESPDGDPERDLAVRRRRAIVRELLHELPEEQAEALAMRFMLGLSLEEVAAASGAPVNTVRSRVRLGKETLLKRLDRDPLLLAALEVDS